MSKIVNDGILKELDIKLIETKKQKYNIREAAPSTTKHNHKSNVLDVLIRIVLKLSPSNSKIKD